jgi:predicted dienelactone hydrolase
MMRSRWILFTVLLLVFVMPLMAQDEAPERTGLRPDAPEFAVRGPFAVGTVDMLIEDAERPLPVAVWYPALYDEGAADYAIYDMGISDLMGEEASLAGEGHAVTGAAPALADAPYPLVVISHGLGGSRYSYFGMSEHLASQGFVVMAVEHVGTAIRDFAEGTADVGSQNTIMSLYYRPADIVRTIDYADEINAADGLLNGLIDTEHIAVWGHSTGGTTVLQAGGARIDFNALSTWCADKESDEFALESCQFLGHEGELAALYGVESAEAALLPSLWDTRVDAIIAAAPGGELHAFGVDGMAAIQVPTLAMVGTGDAIVSPDYNAYWAYDQLGSQEKSLVTFENGGHMMFFNCPPGWKDFCGYDSVWDLPRVEDLKCHFTTAFLKDVFYGDKEAHAALMPENVSFPGISYQTTIH